MKKRDFIVIFCIIVLAGISFIAIKMMEKTGEKVVIYQDKKQYKTVSLYKNQIIEIPANKGHNIVKIQDGKAEMIEASCPDQICVHHRKISNTGETIVCLPNKVVVEIVGKTKRKLDSIAE